MKREVRNIVSEEHKRYMQEYDRAGPLGKLRFNIRNLLIGVDVAIPFLTPLAIGMVVFVIALVIGSLFPRSIAPGCRGYLLALVYL